MLIAMLHLSIDVHGIDPDPARYKNMKLYRVITAPVMGAGIMVEIFPGRMMQATSLWLSLNGDLHVNLGLGVGVDQQAFKGMQADGWREQGEVVPTIAEATSRGSLAPVEITEGKMDKGGVNDPNTSTKRPPPPGGSGGRA